ADWCRDHALTVLRKWLTNNEFQWREEDPSRLWPVQYEGWRLATADLTDDAVCSRTFIEIDLEADPTLADPTVPADLEAEDPTLAVQTFPAFFQFKSEGNAFDLKTSWNIAMETEAQFKK